MSGVVFVVCVPTANFEQSLQYESGSSLPHEDSGKFNVNNSTNMYSVEVELRDKRIDRIPITIQTASNQGYTNQGFTDQRESIHDRRTGSLEVVPMEKVCNENIPFFTNFFIWPILFLHYLFYLLLHFLIYLLQRNLSNLLFHLLRRLLFYLLLHSFFTSFVFFFISFFIFFSYLFVLSLSIAFLFAILSSPPSQSPSLSLSSDLSLTPSPIPLSSSLYFIPLPTSTASQLPPNSSRLHRLHLCKTQSYRLITWEQMSLSEFF